MIAVEDFSFEKLMEENNSGRVCKMGSGGVIRELKDIPTELLRIASLVDDRTVIVASGVCWCDKVGDEGVMRLAYGCPDLRALDLCGCLLITVFGKEIPNVEASDSTVSVNSPR
ncbi:putative inactive protein kinase-like [Capsicum annuum]|nr:putative inactive protein kinase-like [Capsicum annuum]